MNKNELIKKLKFAGMDEIESVLYLSNLEVGLSPVSKIASNAKMNRVTAYGIIQKLAKKSIVSTFIINGIKNYEAIDPDLLISKSMKNITDLKKFLPDIKNISFSSKNNPKILFFNGLEEVKKAYMETIKAKSEILNYANSKNIRKHWKNYDEEYVKKRVKNKIFLRGIAPEDVFGKKIKLSDEENFREIRLIKGDKFNLIENEIKIFDNKVLIASFEPNPFAIIIESEAISITQKQIFEMLWSFLE